MSKADDLLDQYIKEYEQKEQLKKQQENIKQEQKKQEDLKIYQDPQKNKKNITYTQDNHQLQIVTDQHNGNKFKFLLYRFFSFLGAINWRTILYSILALIGVLVVIEIIMNINVILSFLWQCFVAIIIIGIIISLFR